MLRLMRSVWTRDHALRFALVLQVHQLSESRMQLRLLQKRRAVLAEQKDEQLSLQKDLQQRRVRLLFRFTQLLLLN